MSYNGIINDIISKLRSLAIISKLFNDTVSTTGVFSISAIMIMKDVYGKNISNVTNCRLMSR